MNGLVLKGVKQMSMESMVWMRMKVADEQDLKSFRALIELLQYNSVTIEDKRTGFVLAFIMEYGNEKLFDEIDQLNASSELTLMGAGDSWSFESAESIMKLLIDYKETILKDMLVNKEDKQYLTGLFNRLEHSPPKVTFSHLVFRQEDLDVQAGFDEFVWCTYEGCDIPAEYNGKELENGTLKGRDDFLASIPLTKTDIPYCEKHFEYMRLEKFE